MKAARSVTAEIVRPAPRLLGPADSYGGKISFRHVIPLGAVLTPLFATTYLRDRSAGGGRVQRIGAGA